MRDVGELTRQRRTKKERHDLQGEEEGSTREHTGEKSRLLDTSYRKTWGNL